MNLPVVIIEDEPATARNLTHLLQEAEPSVEVLTILSGVTEAVNWLKENLGRCALLFMDIRLNDGLSFEIFDRLNIEKPVIFVTAYNEYALKAFKAGGIDYLLKPFDASDVAGALQKFKRLAGGNAAQQYQRVIKMAESMRTGTALYRQSFLVHYRDKLIPASSKEIAWFYTSNEVVYANTLNNQNYVIEFTLEQLQQELDPQEFFRANRQFIVNRAAIREIEFYFNGRLFVKVHPAPTENIIISKARSSEFKSWMNR